MAGALDLAVSSTEAYKRAQTVTTLASYLPPNQLTGALDLARAIEYLPMRARALAGLVSYLPESERSEVVIEVLATPRTRDQFMWADTLTDLVAPSPPALLPRILAAAGDIYEPQERTTVITALVQAFASNAYLSWKPHWRSELAAAARKGRTNVTADLAAIHSVVVDVGGPEAVRITYQAVVDVARWWP